MRSFALLARHQLGSAIATVVDFSTMTLLVSGAHLSPVLGTIVGATMGAITNFTLGRRWIFAAHAGAAAPQAARYAMTSASSLCLNALGEWLFTSGFRVPYFLARAIVAFVIGIGWNFPMHRYFVFARAREEHAR